MNSKNLAFDLSDRHTYLKKKKNEKKDRKSNEFIALNKFLIRFV